MPFELKWLNAFRAVAATGSVTAAARQLHRVPSAVSYELKRLEQRLGFPVVVRHGRGVRITALGRVLADAVARAWRDLERAIDRAAQPHASAEPLRIAAVSGFGRYRLVPGLLARMPPDRPLEVSFATADEALRLVETGSVGYAVSYRPMIGKSTQSRCIAEEELVLVSPRDASPVRLADLHKLRFVAYDEFEYVFQSWRQAYGLEEPERWRTLDHASELEEALEAVARGRGHCIVPADAAKGHAYRDRLRIDRPGRRRCRNPVYLLGAPSLMDSPDVGLIEKAASAKPR